ncbi:SH3 domain-containing protein [Deferribacter thermophilus]|uniref:SH3 domain-containing protein n=1 Tax=Deferribacter thermophilus TaxID=53573 RepID=UPI003C260A50
MFKSFYTLCLITLFFNLSYADNETSSKKYVEFLGKVKRTTYVYKEPSLSSKKLRVLYEGFKIIIIQDYNNDWYLIKYNNVKTGYVLKKYVEIKNTLKKEVKRGPYQLKKIEIDLDSLIKRYNFYMKESKYYLETGYVPVFKFESITKKGDTLEVKLVYTLDVKDGVKKIDINNPFQDVLKQLIEVIFFKMFVEEAKSYVIKIYEYKDNKKVEYVKLRYQYNDNKYFEIKNYDGKIWDYIESTLDINLLFKTLPLKGVK